MDSTSKCQITELTGRVFDIKRYTLHDGPGIRVSVHLKGCPLACWWCHNPESQSFESQVLFRPERCISCGSCKGLDDIEAAKACPADARELCGTDMTVGEVMKAILKERIFFEQSGGGVTLSGGEPLSQPEFALALLEACKRNEIHTAIDTSGFVDWKVIDATLPLTDIYLYDLKHMNPEKHKEYTGVDNEIILSNLEKLISSGANVNVRVPFVPGLNSDDDNMREMGEFLKKIGGVAQVSLLPYHTAAEDKHTRWGMEYKPGRLYPPTEGALRHAARIIESYGLKTVIGG